MHMNNCISGKRVFYSEDLAREALIQHHIVNDYTHTMGPINVYLCEDCGNWHFTSKGEKNELFDDEEMVEYIKRERRAWQWEKGMR